MLLNNALFLLSGFLIFWAMIGYPIFIKILGKVYKNKKNTRDYSRVPDVTVMIVAHNEEKVISDKLYNICNLNYPIEKLYILVASDNSTDRTNQIVEQFRAENPEFNIELYITKDRKGKTNAQNEAQKKVKTEFLVMTDANAILDKNAIKELMACFTEESISYVTGCLKYINGGNALTSNSEKTYWDSDVSIREIESNIQTITAGNGALYACRNSRYVDVGLIHSHDSAMPFYYALKGERAINCLQALAYEKAGENNKDEFKRKVRMNRDILEVFWNTIKSLNIFKLKWFSIFYFGHRSCRYLLWLNHLIILITNIFNYRTHLIFKLILFFQILFYFLALIYQKTNVNNKYLRLLHYYVITILAQWCGVYNIVTGKSKATWEVAKSTRI